MDNSKTRAIVVAAGRGTRFGRPYNKILHRMGGETILSRCLRALRKSGQFGGGIWCVTAPDETEKVKEELQKDGALSLVSAFVPGGDTRTQSVRHGLAALPHDTDIVAIHDAARCFVPETVVSACVLSARETGSGVPATPVTDTVKEAIDGRAFHTLDRSHLRCVQTPQTFRYDQIMRAYARFAGEATDDAAVYEREYGQVTLVELPECAENKKITHPSDDRDPGQAFRIGMGYDAHRLVEGRALILCGVNIPYEKGLLGHSDADVAVHALMDALLGAAGLGDIGKLFPDSDPAYKGISSIELLKRVCALLHAHGYRPGNCDVTIVAQRPKLMPYREEMARNLAAAMGVDISQVSVKATTTEGMGFEGEGLGISASAVALIR